ncbi:MAG: DNA ligase D, partial [Pseudomonas sp.]
GQLVLALFDLIHLDGVDVRAVPLIERKGLLEELLAASSSKLLSYSSHIEGEGTQAFTAAAGQGFEGIISKRASAPYRPGRGDDWRKTKHLPSDEFAVVGYMAGKGGRKGVGSLLLAKPDPKHGWKYVGRVGTGFTDELLRQLDKKIGKAGDSKPTVEIPGTKGKDLRGAVWFPPMFVVEVFIRGVSNQGVLRQPSLKALRLDKDPEDLLDSDRAPAKKAPKKVGKKASAATPSKAAVAKSKKAATGSSAKVAISSPDKIIFPDQGITKGQVAAYYEAVMDHLLPGIVDRPLSVIRCPGGVGSPCFFQKHHTPGLAHVDLVKLKEEKGNAANYIVVRDERALMELVQFGGLEFHPWGSTAEHPDVANRVVIDLDPGPDVPFSEVKKAAIDVRDLLAQMELTTFVRTTGGKGLHVVVPLNPGCEWDLVKSFAHGFADTLATSQPKRFLSVSTLKLRPGKIFVDYLRNGRGATAVASYSLRGRAGAPVALPIAWSELKALKAGNEFHMDEVLKRLKRRRKDPWEGIDDIEQDLSRWSG